MFGVINEFGGFVDGDHEIKPGGVCQEQSAYFAGADVGEIDDQTIPGHLGAVVKETALYLSEDFAAGGEFLCLVFGVGGMCAHEDIGGQDAPLEISGSASMCALVADVVADDEGFLSGVGFYHAV